MKGALTMHINLYQLVKKSDFKEYYIYLCVESVIPESILSKEITLKGKNRGKSVVELRFKEEFKAEDRFYDLGKCINLINPRADIIAYYLDKFNCFELDKIEHCDNKCCIILK